MRSPLPPQVQCCVWLAAVLGPGMLLLGIILLVRGHTDHNTPRPAHAPLLFLLWAWGACPTLRVQEQRAPVVPNTRFHARTHAVARVS